MIRHPLAASLAASLAAAGAAAAVYLGQAAAWQAPAPAVVVEEDVNRVLELDLPVRPEDVARELGGSTADVLEGTDAGLVTTPAPALELEQPAPARRPAAASTAPAPAAAVPPAPVVVEDQADELVDEAPSCPGVEEWDGERCVARQLPEEALGGARCPDAGDVVVEVRQDGGLVCGRQEA